MSKTIWAALFLLCLVCASCTNQHVVTEFFDPESGKVEARQEAGTQSLMHKPETPPTATLSRDEATASGTVDNPATAIEGANARKRTLTIFGALTILLGVGLLVAKKWLPMLPTTAGSYVVLAGVGMIGLAMVPQWVWAVLAIGGAVAVGLSWWVTRKDKQAAKAAERTVA